MLEISVSIDFVLHEIELTPVDIGCLAQNEPARARVVCDQLRRSDEGIVFVTRIRNLDRGVKGFNGIEDFGHAVRFFSSLQVAAKPESEFGFGYAHEIAVE